METKLVSVEEIAKRQREKMERLQAAYEKVVEECNKKIMNAVKMEQSEIVYYLPQIMIGFPQYTNIAEATEYLRKKLNLYGYRCTTVCPGVVHVQWTTVQEKIKIKKPKKKEEPEPERELSIFEQLQNTAKRVKKNEFSV